MRAVAALALVATVAITGSSGVGIAAAGAATKPDPCKLLKVDEITAALDQPAGPGSNDLAPTVCQWSLFATADRGAGLANAFVERGRRAARDYATAREFNAGDRERVGGLGRKAFFTPSTGTVFVLEDGTTMFYVQANTYSPDKTRVTTGLRDALVELAKQAEARI